MAYDKKHWIIFDFDGTLADSFKRAHIILNELAERYGYSPVNEHEVSEMRRKTARDFFSSIGISMIKLPFVAIQARHELRKYISEVPLFDGMEAVLPALRNNGFHLGILTSNDTENVELFLQNHHLQQFFDFTYCSKDVFGKARRLRALLRKKKLSPDQVIYVGDMDADIEAAHQVNIRVAAVSWGYQAREILERHNPTWLLDAPEQLLSLIKLSS